MQYPQCQHENPAGQKFCGECGARLASWLDTGENEAWRARSCEALGLAEAPGLHPLVAHCHLGLGKLYRRTGKQDEAREHLTTATAMYREMDMRFWLEQAAVETVAL